MTGSTLGMIIIATVTVIVLAAAGPDGEAPTEQAAGTAAAEARAG